MAVAIIGQAARDGGRGRDRQIKKEREQAGGRTGGRSERKEGESNREGDVNQILPVSHVSPATFITIPD